MDDGSTDGTADAARLPEVKVISHGQNKGYGASLKTGIHASSRDYILCCDSDGQHSAEDVARIIEACNGYDMVIGVRGKQFYTSLSRAPGKLIIRKFANYLAGQKIPDLNSGLRMIKREVILRFLHLMPSGFSFSTTSTFALLKGDYRINWVPITISKRIGKSTVRQIKHGSQTLMLILRLTVLFEPLKVFLHATAALLLCTTASFCWDMYLTTFNSIGSTTVIFAVTTITVFMFGLLCDQVSALRREMHDR